MYLCSKEKYDDNEKNRVRYPEVFQNEIKNKEYEENHVNCSQLSVGFERAGTGH
jgi:hypothetical protein